MTPMTRGLTTMTSPSDLRWQEVNPLVHRLIRGDEIVDWVTGMGGETWTVHHSARVFLTLESAKEAAELAHL